MPPSSRRPARLAMPFVASLALLPACAQENAQGLPPSSPPPPSAAATNPPGVAPQTNPPPPAPATTAAPPPNKRVVKRADGTCWEHENVNCPQGATCNPPPPVKVSCPP